MVIVAVLLAGVGGVGAVVAGVAHAIVVDVGQRRCYADGGVVQGAIVVAVVIGVPQIVAIGVAQALRSSLLTL
jgi:hypothetical protein